jgi:hypothetical protein
VWRQSDGNTYRIYSNYSTDGGATWQSDQLIEDNVGFYGEYPRVAFSGTSIVAIWVQSDGTANRIYSNYATFSAAPVVVSPVPTLTEWGIIFLMVVLGISSASYLKRRQSTR